MIEKAIPNDYALIGPSEDGGINDLLASLNAKESRQRLQALIAEWVRMENLVVLTGAGTSVTAGGKTMDSLERVVLATVRTLPDAPATIAAVIDARLAPSGAGAAMRLGFEDWLSYLVNATSIGSTPNSPFAGIQWKGSIDPTAVAGRQQMRTATTA